MRIPLFLFIAAMLSVSVSAQKAYDDPEAYAVYSALIRDYMKSESGPLTNLVIVPETTEYPHFGGDYSKIENCVKPGQGEENAFTEMYRSYHENNATPVLLQDKFDLPFRYQLIARSV